MNAPLSEDLKAILELLSAVGQSLRVGDSARALEFAALASFRAQHLSDGHELLSVCRRLPLRKRRGSHELRTMRR